jgi:hypothetical protein
MAAMSHSIHVACSIQKNNSRQTALHVISHSCLDFIPSAVSDFEDIFCCHLTMHRMEYVKCMGVYFLFNNKKVCVNCVMNYGTTFIRDIM